MEPATQLAPVIVFRSRRSGMDVGALREDHGSASLATREAQNGSTQDAFQADHMVDRLDTLHAKLDEVAETLARYGLAEPEAQLIGGAGDTPGQLAADSLAGEAPPQDAASAKRQRLAQFMTAMSGFCTRQEALASRVETRVSDLEDAVIALLSEGLMNRKKLAHFMDAFDGAAEGLLERMEGAATAPEADETAGAVDLSPGRPGANSGE